MNEIGVEAKNAGTEIREVIPEQNELVDMLSLQVIP